MLETATKYILDLLTENEELKKFPKELINESVKWVKSWFLKPEDPKTTAKLEDPNKSIDVKKDIIQDKLDDLKNNPQFQKELTERLAAFEQQRSRLKNYIGEKGEIESDGKVHLGDRGGSINDNYDQKNILHGKIKAKGDVRIGDDIIASNENVHFGDIHYHGAHTNPIANTTPPQYVNKKAELKALLAKGKTVDVIERLLDITERTDNDIHNSVLIQSARFYRISDKEEKRIITESEANVERNQINNSLTSIIDKLEM